ncbi:signal recognition particle subunit [Glugoides intestinalis]
MENTSEYFEIYPIYFDSTISLAKGRKYSVERCVTSPTYKEIKNALGQLSATYTEETCKRHPKDLKTIGRFKINKESISRKQIIEKLGEKIKEIRRNVISINKDANNIMGLVPKSRKKAKKNKI